MANRTASVSATSGVPRKSKVLGTGLAVNLYWLIGFAVALLYFAYSATVEERTLTATFPDAYPEYKAHTKMLIPFLL